MRYELDQQGSEQDMFYAKEIELIRLLIQEHQISFTNETTQSTYVSARVIFIVGLYHPKIVPKDQTAFSQASFDAFPVI